MLAELRVRRSTLESSGHSVHEWESRIRSTDDEQAHQLRSAYVYESQDEARTVTKPVASMMTSKSIF